MLLVLGQIWRPSLFRSEIDKDGLEASVARLRCRTGIHLAIVPHVYNPGVRSRWTGSSKGGYVGPMGDLSIYKIGSLRKVLPSKNASTYLSQMCPSYVHVS